MYGTDPFTDDPLGNYHPANYQPTPPAAPAGYGAAAPQPQAAPQASQFPVQQPAPHNATPQVAPAPPATEAPAAELPVIAEAMGVKLGPEHTITVAWVQPGLAFGMPGADLRLEESFSVVRADGTPLDGGERQLLIDAAVVDLTAAAYDIAKHHVLAMRKRLATEPDGFASLHQANWRPEQPPAGTQAGQPAPQGTGAAAIAAVANGAETGERWAENKTTFGNSSVRYVTSSAYSTEKLEAGCVEWLRGQGLDPKWFKFYDERPGTRTGVGVGEPMTAAANLKFTDEAKAVLRQRGFADLEKMAVARVTFNDNESLYIYFGKNGKNPKADVSAFMAFAGLQLFGPGQ